jgi:hypothetical protein
VRKVASPQSPGSALKNRTRILNNRARCGDTVVFDLFGGDLRLVENGAGFSEVADFHEHFAELGQQAGSHRILLVQELDGAPEQVRRCMHVASTEGAATGA